LGGFVKNAEKAGERALRRRRSGYKGGTKMFKEEPRNRRGKRSGKDEGAGVAGGPTSVKRFQIGKKKGTVSLDGLTTGEKPKP